MTTIKFSKKSFDRITTFAANKENVGQTNFNWWSSEVDVEINNRKLKFVKKGFWKTGFFVQNESGQNIAEVEFETWSSDIKVVLEGSKVYNLRKRGVFSSNFDVYQNEIHVMEIVYEGLFWQRSGEINFKESFNETLALLGIISQTAVEIQRRRAAAAAGA